MTVTGLAIEKALKLLQAQIADLRSRQAADMEPLYHHLIEARRGDDERAKRHWGERIDETRAAWAKVIDPVVREYMHWQMMQPVTIRPLSPSESNDKTR